MIAVALAACVALLMGAGLTFMTLQFVIHTIVLTTRREPMASYLRETSSQGALSAAVATLTRAVFRGLVVSTALALAELGFAVQSAAQVARTEELFWVLAVAFLGAALLSAMLKLLTDAQTDWLKLESELAASVAGRAILDNDKEK